MSRIVLYSKMWRSGTGLYVQGLARGLANAGHDLIFVAPAGDPEDVADTVPGIRRVMPPREYVEADQVSRPARAIRSLRRIVAGCAALLQARFSASRFVVTIPEPLPVWLPMLALLRASGAQVVFVCHDPEPHAWRLPESLRSVERGAIALSYRLASRIVVLSSAGRTALVNRFGIAADRIDVIQHGAFDMASAGPLPGHGRMLLFGTIRRNKNVVAAMRAVAQVAGSGARLVVAGGPDANDPDYMDECRVLAAELGDVVTLEIGYIDDARVAELLQESDALLLPYTNFESQSGVAVLAGMAGRPVICAAAGGIPDLIEGGLAAVIIEPPAGVDQIAAAIGRYLAIPAAEWSRRATAGREKLGVELNWTRVGAAFGYVFD